MVKCPTCKNEYLYIGVHWAKSSCDYPPIKNYEGMIIGLLLGDGSINSGEKNCYLEVAMTNKTFLKFLDRRFSILSRGVKLNMPAEQSEQYWSKWRKSNNKTETVNMDNRNDIWKMETRAHPELNKLREWYASGEKIFPDDLEFTPIVAKYWYVSDGNLNWNENAKTPQLAIANYVQASQKELMCDWFCQHGFTPKTIEGEGFYFPTSETADILKWMGDPVPGFEYKWECSDYEEYKKLKR